MSKTKKDEPKSLSASKKAVLIYVINRMQCGWAVPAQLRPGESYRDVTDEFKRMYVIGKKVTFVPPNGYTVVDKQSFKEYYNTTRAFQAMVDQGMLEVVDKESRVKPVHKETLKSIREAKPPKILTGEGNKYTATHIGLKSNPSAHLKKMQDVTPIT